jgi:hypothetical protein
LRTPMDHRGRQTRLQGWTFEPGLTGYDTLTAFLLRDTLAYSFCHAENYPQGLDFICLLSGRTREVIFLMPDILLHGGFRPHLSRGICPFIGYLLPCLIVFALQKSYFIIHRHSELISIILVVRLLFIEVTNYPNY